MSQQILQTRSASYCFLDNVCIFLDRENDKYHYLDREKTKMIDALQHGLSRKDSTQPDRPAVEGNAIQELMEKHLLTTRPEDGKTLRPVAHKSPHASVYANYWKRGFYPATIAYLAFRHASLQRKVKEQSLYETTQHAEKLKTDLRGHIKDVSTEEMTVKARQIIDSRYFIYTYRDKCLFDSYLFFSHFVKQRIPVDWVFGVNLYPFSAHCWVEYKGLALNDQLERVASFTPIYVI